MSSLEIRSPLLHLALLETLKTDDIQDEIDLFLPFIAVTTSDIGKQTINESDIQERLFDSFGFRPPISAVKVLMTRARKRGLFIKENHAFIPCHEKINIWKNGFENKQDDVSISLQSLKNGFIYFSESQFEKKLTEQDAEKLIFDFIEQNVSCVISEKAYRKSQLSDRIKNKDHLIASFISYIHHHQPVLLEHFSRCVKGMLLANYLCYADKGTDKKSYSGITVYLDSPIVLGLLGYSGRQAKDSFNYFINLLSSLKINICIFDKTHDEIEGLLYAWKIDLERKNYERFNTKTLEWLRSEGYDPERLDTEIKLLSISIERLGINLIQGFKSQKKYQCDEVELQNSISRRFSPTKNYEHDTICISRVHNLRLGRKITNLNQTFSIFVTQNTPLQMVAHDFFHEELGRDSIPLVVSEQWMTAMFWLKKPDIYSSLPQGQLLSTAYSLLYTDDHFWRSFLERFEKIKKRGEITEDDFLRIRWDSDLLRLVHRISVDVGDDFSEEDIFDIVEKINKKNNEKHSEEMNALRIEKQEEINALKNDSIELMKIVDVQLNTVSASLDNIKLKIKKISTGISYIIAYTIMFFFIFAIAFYGIKGVPDDIKSDFVKYIVDNASSSLVVISAVLTIILNLASGIFGINLIVGHKKIQVYLERKLTGWFCDE